MESALPLARVRIAVAAGLIFFAAFPAKAVMPAVPRKSPELTIVEPSGKQLLLTSFRGKVVLVAFIHTTCIYCQALTVKLVKLHKELGPKGFQPLAIAWNPEAPVQIPTFIREFGVQFPVGYSEWEPLRSYLGYGVLDRPVTPLVAVIDRKGFIRAEAPPDGDSNLQNEAKLRALITSLLAEGSAAPAKRTQK